LNLPHTPEFEWIQRLQTNLISVPEIVANGDDAAVLDWRGPLVIAKDLMVEGVHFRRDWSSPEQVARKLLVSNLSDLEAMGALPQGALLGCVLGGLSAEERDIWADALKAAFEMYQLPLWGGDTSSGTQILLSLTVLGMLPGRALTRDSAKPGMKLYITSPLGASAAGLHCLQKRSELDLGALSGLGLAVQAHLDPELKLGMGSKLAGMGCESAIDLSDGLMRSAEIISHQSGVSLEIHIEKIPSPDFLKPMADFFGVDYKQWLLCGGEEYCLLAAGWESLALLDCMEKGEIWEVGEVKEGAGIDWKMSGSSVAIKTSHFEHF
jgi:thiamine-monophosphate kinase